MSEFCNYIYSIIKIEDLVIVLDREQGGEEAMLKEKVTLHKLVTLKELLSYMVDKELANYSTLRKIARPSSVVDFRSLEGWVK